MRVLIKISYDGSKFLGFQQQTHTAKTVMGKLDSAFDSLGIKTQIIGSGRTDKGVHASNQVLHVDIPAFWSDFKRLKVMLNRHLHPNIHVKKIYAVKEDFHARFSPIKREYRYIFSHSQFSPFLSSYVHFYPRFDLKRLNEILSIFKGEHNFEYFKKNGSDTTNFVREIYKIKALSIEDKTAIVIQANGFLRSQIRLIISAILKTYEEQISLQELKDQLACKSLHVRTLAPPNGLYLHKIYYPKDIYI